MLRSVFLVAGLSLPMIGLAQMPTSMSEQDMQALMAAMQEMQACYQKVDQQALQELQEQSQKVVVEMQSLCDSGKRDAAQEKAKHYSRQMMENEAVKQMEECAQKLPASLKEMAGESPLDLDGFDDLKNSHICDAGNFLP